MGHCDCFRQVEEDILALVRLQAYSAAMPLFKIQREGAGGFVLWPMSGGVVNGGGMHGHTTVST